MRKKCPYNVTDKFNLLVIDFPYFSKNLEGGFGNPQRLGFFVARRQSAHRDTWTVERQFYTRRTDSISESGSDFDHRPHIKIEGTRSLIEEFQKFELECLQDGMARHDRDGSNYTYGACLPKALELLEYHEKVPHLKVVK